MFILKPHPKFNRRINAASGAHGETRTHDLTLTKGVLYP
jgi:hypothetical protein